MSSPAMHRDLAHDVLEHLPYTEAVIFETMRLYPTAPALARESNAATRVRPGCLKQYPVLRSNPNDFSPVESLQSLGGVQCEKVRCRNARKVPCGYIRCCIHAFSHLVTSATLQAGPEDTVDLRIRN